MKPTNDMSCFLAHAIVLEDEAAEQYDELADTMAMHRNRPVEELFRRMAGFSRLHRDEAIELARLHAGALPDLKPWEFEWVGDESPESAAGDQAHYLMTAHHALQLALAAERRAEQFYAHIAASSDRPDICAQAAEFAAEEAEHAEILVRWLARTPQPVRGWAADPDPPNVVE